MRGFLASATYKTLSDRPRSPSVLSVSLWCIFFPFVAPWLRGFFMCYRTNPSVNLGNLGPPHFRAHRSLLTAAPGRLLAAPEVVEM